MYEPSVFSGITQVSQQGNKFQCEDGSEAVEVVVQGWAWAGGGRNIARVDITGDGKCVSLIVLCFDIF
jgi:sulfite oxidase